MQLILPGLHASAPKPLPFAPSMDMRAFLLEREPGNLLVYSLDGLDAEEPAITELGGVRRQYLNHHRQAEFVSGRPAASLYVPDSERKQVQRHASVHGTFTGRHTLDDDFEVIPTPGHTVGATTFLWTSGRHRILFTGDTLFLDGDEWVTAVLGSSDREAYVESLRLIRELDFDVLVPWLAPAGQPPHS